MFDRFATENSWVLRNKCDDSETTSRPYLAGEQDYSEEFCVGPGEYMFTLSDKYGDGICRTYGDGAFEVFYKGESVASGKSATFFSEPTMTASGTLVFHTFSFASWYIFRDNIC